MKYILTALSGALLIIAACTSPLAEDTPRNRVVESGQDNFNTDLGDPPGTPSFERFRAAEVVATFLISGIGPVQFRSDSGADIFVDTSATPAVITFDNVQLTSDPSSNEPGIPGSPMLYKIMLDIASLPVIVDDAQLIGNAGSQSGSFVEFLIKNPGNADTMETVYPDGNEQIMRLFNLTKVMTAGINGQMKITVKVNGFAQDYAGTIAIHF